MALSTTRAYEALSAQPTAEGAIRTFHAGRAAVAGQPRSCERCRSPTPGGAEARTAPGGGFIRTQDGFSPEGILLVSHQVGPHPCPLCPDGLITRSHLRECSTDQGKRQFRHCMSAACTWTASCSNACWLVFVFVFEIFTKRECLWSNPPVVCFSQMTLFWRRASV